MKEIINSYFFSSFPNLKLKIKPIKGEAVHTFMTIGLKTHLPLMPDWDLG